MNDFHHIVLLTWLLSLSGQRIGLLLIVKDRKIYTFLVCRQSSGRNDKVLIAAQRHLTCGRTKSQPFIKKQEGLLVYYSVIIISFQIQLIPHVHNRQKENFSPSQTKHCSLWIRILPIRIDKDVYCTLVMQCICWCVCGCSWRERYSSVRVRLSAVHTLSRPVTDTVGSLLSSEASTLSGIVWIQLLAAMVTRAERGWDINER